MQRSATNWSSYGLDGRRLLKLLPLSLRLRAMMSVLERNLHRQAHLTTALAQVTELMTQVEQRLHEEGLIDARKSSELLF